MSSRSRRKTLCHNEIENFLNEIGSNNEDIQQNARKRRSTIIPNEIVQLENINGNISSNDDDIFTTAHKSKESISNKRNSISFYNKQEIGNKSTIVAEDHNSISNSQLSSDNDSKQTLISPQLSTKTSSAVPFNQTTSKSSEESDEESIREFCKLTFQDLGQHRDLVQSKRFDIAKKIYANTTYNLLPNRWLYPEQYEHPSSTLESKKALLLSLAPCLDDAEKQRKIDVSTAEEFTRCRVQKIKGRSSFEYRDIDIGVLITEEEYEKRYLLFLKSQKQDSSSSDIHVLQNTWQTYSSQTSTEMTYSEVSEEINTMDYDFLENSFDRDCKEKNVGRSRGRRDTLSPASARTSIKTYEKRRQSIDFNLLPMDLEDQSYESNLLPGTIDDFTKPFPVIDSVPEVVLVTTSTATYVESVSSSVSQEDKLVDDFKSELDALLADNEDDVDHHPCAMFSKDEPIKPNVSEITCSSIIVDKATDTIIVKEDLNDIIIEEVSLTDEEVLQNAQEMAYSRMRIRMEQSWWKYQWELVSKRAALLAKQINNDRS